jgi:hypothetical protein
MAHSPLQSLYPILLSSASLLAFFSFCLLPNFLLRTSGKCCPHSAPQVHPLLFLCLLCTKAGPLITLIFSVTDYLKSHQCSIYLLSTSYFTNICWIGCLDITKHSQLYLVRKYDIGESKLIRCLVYCSPSLVWHVWETQEWSYYPVVVFSLIWQMA